VMLGLIGNVGGNGLYARLADRESPRIHFAMQSPGLPSR
jgi:hypothetical protein